MQHKPLATYRLNDYQVPNFLIDHISLELDLSQNPVRSKSQLTLRRNPASKQAASSLTLDGENMKLIAISVNGKACTETDYELTDHSLTLNNIPNDAFFTVESETELGENKDLFGLYKTEGTWLVKAETEGMRRVLYCLDRPDVLSRYTTTIIAEESEFPTLLSNGDLLQSKKMANGLHSVTWIDNTPKSTYLFAVVAGKLERISTDYLTKSNAKQFVDFYVRPNATEQCRFAMEVIKKAKAWDEQTYGLTSKLKNHKVAGVDKYASGASEPTGMTLFNSEYLFATPDMKTDEGYLRIAEVVSHENFHEWSGNYVTIRNWPNLPFKEGLTSFRAAEFCESLFGEDLMRAMKGKTLEEGAPRQAEYTAVRSLYTAAAYDKSAEIFRMIKLVLGAASFYSGMHDFLSKNFGKAVTLEEMLQSLSVYSGMDLSQFLLWFTQAGVPTVEVTAEFDAKNKRYTLKMKQMHAAKDSKILPIPVVVSLFAADGTEIVKDVQLMLDEAEKTFTFDNVAYCPVPSLLRGFSAPVKLNYEYKEEELLILLQHETNAFNRVEVANKLIILALTKCLETGIYTIDNRLIDCFKQILIDPALNPWVAAMLLTVPSVTVLARGIKKYNLDELHHARESFIKAITSELAPFLTSKLNELNNIVSVAPSDFDQMGFNIALACNRRLKYVCMHYLSKVIPKEIYDQCAIIFDQSLKVNMTDTMAALEIMTNIPGIDTSQILDRYFDCWKHDPSAINNWFKIQAAACTNDVIEKVAQLLNHPAFDLANPNKVLALVRAFITNPVGFHDKSGKGYELYAALVLQVEAINPTLAANVLGPLMRFDEFDVLRQNLMRDQLVYLEKNVKSDNLRQPIKKALAKPFVNQTLSNNVASNLMTWLPTADKTLPTKKEESKARIGMQTKGV